MAKLTSSPKRGSFLSSRYAQRKQELGEEVNPAYEDLFKSLEQRRRDLEKDSEWQKHNMEYDLRSTEWIVAKVRSSNRYAQNLYAAMCNNDFQEQQVWPILKGDTWSCSWRYAGGIVADMRGEGDYIDWYCSGIRGGDDPMYDAGVDSQGYVPESSVTDEIREDLALLGWRVIQDSTSK